MRLTMKLKGHKIIFLSPYPYDQAPSQRFRFEQYMSMLKNQGWTVKFYAFTQSSSWKIIYADHQFLKKVRVLIIGIVKRLFILFAIPSQSFVFIHRELSPVGPPFFEWVIAKILRKKIIYDFDDSIWLTDKTNESKLAKFIRWRSKVASICRWSYRISCGNAYLADYARNFNPNVIVNPTTLETDQLHNPARYSKKNNNNNKLIIGWTGSHSTLKYLHKMEPVLNHLQQKYSMLHFLVIADRKPELNIKRMEFVPWNKETEALDLLRMDIGIMPLPDDEWSKGKCGFKVLQYMAMEIPCVASPVGVNTEIIDHGHNGFLAYTDNEWIKYLDDLIQHTELRKAFGKAGRTKVLKGYSVNSNASTFLSLFDLKR